MIPIDGPWEKGYAFDIHTYASIFIGNNEFGYPMFNTTRSPMGQFLYELKYGQHLPVLDKIAELIVNDSSFNQFINSIDIILPVPPSNKYRKIQPVQICSEKISEKYGKELRSDILSSTNKDELKDVPTEEKYQKIKDAITVDEKIKRTKRILIFDDVYDSGSTLSAITTVLNEKGYLNVSIFTLTKTRKAD